MKPRHVIYTVLATVVIFAAGVVTGGVLVRKTSLKPPVPPPQGAQMWRLDQFNKMVDQLNLPPDQDFRVRRHIRERQEYIADMMRLIEPDLPGVFNGLRRDIMMELRPEQQRRLEDMWARFERQKKFQNRPGEAMGFPEGPKQFGPERRMVGPDGQPLPTRSGPRPGRQFQDRPQPGEPPPANPPPTSPE